MIKNSSKFEILFSPAQLYLVQKLFYILDTRPITFCGRRFKTCFNI